MSSEGLVFPNDLFGCTMKESPYGMEVGSWGYAELYANALNIEEERNVIAVQGVDHEGHAVHGNWTCSHMLQSIDECEQVNLSSQETAVKDKAICTSNTSEATVARKRKRQRTKIVKNKEEMENLRKIHITVERNKRKQMNDHLAVLKTIMPRSYIPKGDQASVVGGAINFLKELEQLAHSLEAEKRKMQRTNSAPFADFFTFPQYSTAATLQCTNNDAYATVTGENYKKASVADIEVTMVESHANLKVLTKRHPKQLLKMIEDLHNLWLSTLHVNVTPVDELVLYSFSLKVEEECQMTSVYEIATAVHQIVGKIQEELAIF